MIGDGYMIEDAGRRAVRTTGVVAQCMAVTGGTLGVLGTTVGPDRLQVPGVVLIILSLSIGLIGVIGAFVERRPISTWCGICPRNFPHDHAPEPRWYPGRDA